jgi:hypothetical protein
MSIPGHYRLEHGSEAQGFGQRIVDDHGVIALVKARGKRVNAGPLLAAAPAMLVVLKALEWCNEYAHMPGSEPVFECPCCGALNEAGPEHEPDCELAAAIALAEGRQ